MPGQNYRICIHNHLDTGWMVWFENLVIQHEANGVTTMTGFIPDQSALYGMLMKLRDLGLELISVEPVENPMEQLT